MPAQQKGRAGAADCNPAQHNQSPGGNGARPGGGSVGRPRSSDMGGACSAGGITAGASRAGSAACGAAVAWTILSDGSSAAGADSKPALGSLPLPPECRCRPSLSRRAARWRANSPGAAGRHWLQMKRRAAGLPGRKPNEMPKAARQGRADPGRRRFQDEIARCARWGRRRSAERVWRKSS